MRRDTDWARERFAEARVARLATVSADGSPHLVPIVFAASETRLVSAVDQKPKTTNALRRLDNIAGNPFVSVLVDSYAEDWSRLWWARADGWARVLATSDVPEFAALIARYPQYSDEPPRGPVIIIEVDRWTGWSAG